MTTMYIEVGNIVVGAFASLRSPAAVRCFRMIAPGCVPHIKKCPRSYYAPKAPMRDAEATRQQPKRHQETCKIRYLKPGEFKL